MQIDSGTTLNYLPTPFAQFTNSLFQPPAVWFEEYGAFFVECDAQPPSFRVQINGTVFNINPLDMILPAGSDSNGNQICISGITDGGDYHVNDVFILGDVFQKNVVSVFDFGAAKMSFLAREYY